MIYETLQIIADEVNVFFRQQGLADDGDVVVLDNIALADSDHESAAEMANKVVLSLLTIDEEATLRNMPNKSVVSNRTEYKNEKINLNLYVLFSGNKTFYKDSLRFVSKVIEFFQSKNKYTQANTSFNRSLPPFDEIEEFRFTLELYTPTFEDLNYIWGTLGGKQYPSALYKLSLVTIYHNRPVTEAPNLNEVDINLIDTNA